MGLKGLVGWGEIEAIVEVEVPTMVTKPKAVKLGLRVLCGKCGKPMQYSSTTDEEGDVTVIAECDCMFGEANGN